jgi:hypothetical protein
MPQQPNPQDSSRPAPRDDEGADSGQYEESMNQDGASEPVATFVDLVNELNQHLSQLEYALLDLKEVLVQCDRLEHGKLERQAAGHIERIRTAAKDDPGFPPLTD